MRRFLGLVLVASGAIALGVLLWLGWLGKVVVVSSGTTSSGDMSMSYAVAEIDVQWRLVLPLVALVAVGLVLVFWRRRVAAGR